MKKFQNLPSESISTSWVSLASLFCIRPNAEMNVKPALQGLATWTLLILFITSMSLPATFLSENALYAADNLDSPPAAVSDAPVEGSPVSVPPVATWTPNEIFRPITANQFSVQVLKHSASNKIYLFLFSNAKEPKPGEILLLKDKAESIMAFRVLKTTAADHTFVGQVIKKYDKHMELETGEQYEALIKVGDIEDTSDIIEAPEAEFENPNWSSDEANAILAYDPELDVGSISPKEAAEIAKNHPLSPIASLESKVAFLESKVVALETKTAANEYLSNREPTESKKPLAPPQTKSGKKSEDDDDTESKPVSNDKASEKLDDDLLDTENTAVTQDSMAVDELKLFDNYSHWLSVGFGYVTNNAPTGSSVYNFSAGNLKYGVTIGRRILAEKAHLQDSLVLEGKLYVYKGINFAAQGDSYTLLALGGNLRYNLFFSESVGIFGYAGLLQSNVLASSSPVASALVALNSVLPSVGAGILLQIGPSWYARLDVGLDDTSLNLLIRF